LLLELVQQGKLSEALAADPPAPRLEQRLVVLKAVWQEWDTLQGTTHARLLRAQARSVLGDVQWTRRFLRTASEAFKQAATAGTSRLPADEQEAVLRLVGQGEEQIQRGAHWLVVHHLWLVKTLAVSCRRLGVPESELADIMQEGCVGLLAAADLFDVRKGARFRTYATLWVRQAVGRYLHARRVVSPPRALQQTASKLRRTARHLEQLWARDVSPEELAASVGLLPQEVIEAFAAQNADLSLETPVGDGLTLGDVLADPSASAFFNGTAGETPDEEDVDEPDRKHAPGLNREFG
jgi:RNA polymerase primary sigma factor